MHSHLPLHPHTQATQAKSKESASQRTTTDQMNGQHIYRQEGRRHNIGFAKWRVKCFYDSLVQGSNSVFQLKFCAENPPLRKAENRLKKK